MSEVTGAFSVGIALGIAFTGIVTRIESLRRRAMPNFPREWKREVLVMLALLAIGTFAYLNHAASIWRLAVVTLGLLFGKQVVRFLEIRGERLPYENFDDD